VAEVSAGLEEFFDRDAVRGFLLFIPFVRVRGLGLPIGCRARLCAFVGRIRLRIGTRLVRRVGVGLCLGVGFCVRRV
jgi:hypothetical protein